MTAKLVYFMGPSGAGKDSLLAWLHAQQPAAQGRIHWVQRTISRSATPGAERYESVSPETFAALRQARAFALHWQANGLGYGIRHAQLAPLTAGQWVLVNGSRAYLADALMRWPDLLAVHITASAAVLRARLLARGRESTDMIESRVQRALQFTPPSGSVPIELHNDGTLDDAGQRLLSALRQCPGWPG